MDFQWLDPEGTPNRRWRAVMPREVWQQVVNIRLYGSHPPPPGTPQLFLKKPRKTRCDTAVEHSGMKEKNKRRRMRRLAKAKAAKKTVQPQ
jgi:hypothetical protein